MGPLFCIFGLALVWLVTSSAQAHGRSFAWFFAHSRPDGTCSGQHSRDLLCLRAADREWSDIRSQRVYGRAAFRIAGNGDESSEREVYYSRD